MTLEEVKDRLAEKQLEYDRTHTQLLKLTMEINNLKAYIEIEESKQE